MTAPIRYLEVRIDTELPDIRTVNRVAVRSLESRLLACWRRDVRRFLNESVALATRTGKKRRVQPARFIELRLRYDAKSHQVTGCRVVQIDRVGDASRVKLRKPSFDKTALGGESAVSSHAPKGAARPARGEE